ncbi:11746_t:CDS:2 [Scutellospora calospora]|uniref:11746_t:CDS:1 n=1 Tax=Scutellospora calospora TaxID=85575 RepID=A0ACA9LGJ4_9GLOM|nr:11746_t:CDS:2 [Scutellospora calospora]
MLPIKYYSTLEYYAVHVGHNSGLYLFWNKCKEQVHKYPNAMYKKFDTKQYNGKPRAIASIGVFFTDNDQCNLLERLPGLQQTNNRAELFAMIRALEICDKNQDITINTDSTYVINCYNTNVKINSDLVNRMNYLIREREGKTYFNQVKGYSRIYKNEQADKLAYLGSLKEYIKDFNFSSTNREKIDFYFKKQNKKDDSENITDSYLLEFTRVLQLLEENNNKNKLLIETRNKNIYLMLSENRIKKWLKNNWCYHESIVKLKAPKEICIRIKNLIDSQTNEIEFNNLTSKRYDYC